MKNILKATVLTVGALAISSAAYAGTTEDNNREGVSQYTKLSEKYQGGTAFDTKVKHKKMQEIEPAAGAQGKLPHEDSSRYNAD